MQDDVRLPRSRMHLTMVGFPRYGDLLCKRRNVLSNHRGGRTSTWMASLNVNDTDRTRPQTQSPRQYNIHAYAEIGEQQTFFDRGEVLEVSSSFSNPNYPSQIDLCLG